jgi:1-aminocyclopropane-1-carboxylate deaminase/D-cysteine desulfhydrase-like pyridoxal-dependent ACC family enzyme
MAALVDHIRRGQLTAGQKVVFIHTGGTPALFAYHAELEHGIAPRRM